MRRLNRLHRIKVQHNATSSLCKVEARTKRTGRGFAYILKSRAPVYSSPDMRAFLFSEKGGRLSWKSEIVYTAEKRWQSEIRPTGAVCPSGDFCAFARKCHRFRLSETVAFFMKTTLLRRGYRCFRIQERFGKFCRQGGDGKWKQAVVAVQTQRTMKEATVKITVNLQKTAVLSVFCPGVPQSSRRFGKSVQYSDATGR